MILLGIEAENLLADSEKGKWYFYFWNCLDTRNPANVFNNMSIISFNYDLSLEQFFYNVLCSLNKDDQAAANAIKGLNIIHPYGTIGRLKWELRDEGFDREYGQYRKGRRSMALLRSISSSIRTISEAEDRNIFRQCKDLLAQAEYIYLLGFGYNLENMQRLGLSRYEYDATVYGTTLDYSQVQISHKIYGGRFRINTNSHKVWLDRLGLDDIEAFLKDNDTFQSITPR